MPVSKNKRKKKKKAHKSQGINEMKTLLREGMNNFIEVYNTLSTHHQDIAKLIKAYNYNYVWADETPIDTIRIANQSVENVETGLVQNQTTLNQCFDRHESIRVGLEKGEINAEDANWSYIELLETLLSQLSPFIPHAFSVLEKTLHVRVQYNKQG